MRLQINGDCTSISIISDYLLNTNQAVEVKIVHNGTTTFTPDFGNNPTSITILPTHVGGTTKIPQGIYAATLVTTAQNGDKHTETSCESSLCSLICTSLEDYTNLENLPKILALEALKVAKNCVTCSCTVMLDLYNIITSNPTTNDCGCS